MNIAVINIKDLIKYITVLIMLLVIVISGIKIVKGREEFEHAEALSKTKDSSFLHCLDMEIPLIANDNSNELLEKNTLASNYKILDAELEMLYSLKYEDNILKDDTEVARNPDEENKEENESEEEQIDRTVDTEANLETKVISENNIEASFTDTANDIQVKNQSKYDLTELISNSNYELKNKDKIIIYHTHTCESYTSSEKYNYQMTGTYRTTDLRYTVARARR